MIAGCSNGAAGSDRRHNVIVDTPYVRAGRYRPARATHVLTNPEAARLARSAPTGLIGIVASDKSLGATNRCSARHIREQPKGCLIAEIVEGLLADRASRMQRFQKCMDDTLNAAATQLSRW